MITILRDAQSGEVNDAYFWQKYLYYLQNKSKGSYLFSIPQGAIMIRGELGPHKIHTLLAIFSIEIICWVQLYGEAGKMLELFW